MQTYIHMLSRRNATVLLFLRVTTRWKCLRWKRNSFGCLWRPKLCAKHVLFRFANGRVNQPKQFCRTKTATDDRLPLFFYWLTTFSKNINWLPIKNLLISFLEGYQRSYTRFILIQDLEVADKTVIQQNHNNQISTFVSLFLFPCCKILFFIKNIYFVDDSGAISKHVEHVMHHLFSWHACHEHCWLYLFMFCHSKTPNTTNTTESSTHYFILCSS